MTEAVRSGQVKEATITMAVGRILVQMDRFGLLDGKQKHSITEEDHAFNAPVLQKTAEDAATLLKNRDNVLPLTTADLESTAFIGPTGRVLVSVGQTGERAQGLPDHQVGPVPSLEKIAGTKVTYAVANDFDGTPIPASALSDLVRTNAAGTQTQPDTDLNFTNSNKKALPAGTSFKWTGTLNIPRDGTYTIALQTRGTTGVAELDGTLILGGGGGGRGGGGRGGTSAPAPQLPPAVAALRGQHPISGSIVPTVDKLNNARVRIEIKTGPHQLTVTSTGETFGNPVQIRLAWVTPEQESASYEAAIAAARQAKKAVVFAWGRDRPDVFKLTPEQTRLIQDVAAVNPNTIVVLSTSLPVEMPWLDKVKGVLQMWWPGDQGGPATARILLGQANPAGRLPMTWPVRLDQMVAQDPKAHPERTNQGVDGKTTYSEGIFVGYRWFDQQNLTPMFPFGFGLSYTSFQYSGMKVVRAKDGGLDVSFTVKNAGRVAGDEVSQIYLGAPKNPPAGAQFAVKALAQFERVTLAPGQSKSLTLHVEPRRLQVPGRPQTENGRPLRARERFMPAHRHATSACRLMSAWRRVRRPREKGTDDAESFDCRGVQLFTCARRVRTDQERIGVGRDRMDESAGRQELERLGPHTPGRQLHCPRRIAERSFAVEAGSFRRNSGVRRQECRARVVSIHDRAQGSRAACRIPFRPG